MTPAMAYLVVAGIFVVIAAIVAVFILGARAAAEAHPPDRDEEK